MDDFANIAIFFGFPTNRTLFVSYLISFQIFSCLLKSANRAILFHDTCAEGQAFLHIARMLHHIGLCG